MTLAPPWISLWHCSSSSPLKLQLRTSWSGCWATEIASSSYALMWRKLGPVTRRKSRDETRSRRQVTRRDETRDGLASFVSRLIVTRRDEIRDQVKKKKILAQIFLQISRLKCYFFFRDRKFNSRPSCATKSRDETRSRWSRLVSSRFFSRRDRLVTGPSGK